MDVLNNFRVGKIDDDVQELLKAIFINKSDKNYPKEAFQIYAENERAMKKNTFVLNDLRDELYTIIVTDKVPDNCKYQMTLMQAAQNQKETITGDLAILLNLRNSANVMLIVNMDIQDRLINDQSGNAVILNLLKAVFVKCL